MESRNREKLLLISLISLVLLGFFAVNLRKQLLIKQKREQELLAVTQRLEQSQEKLKSSKIRYQALMEQSFEALALVDAKTQEIVEINHQFTKLFGYSLPEDAPLYVKQVVDVPQRELDIVLGDTLKRQGFLPPVSRTYSHKNGTEVPVERAVTAITLDGGEYLLSSMRDLTEEQRRQKALAVSLGELRIKQDLLEKTNALLVESQQALIHQATHDSLTGLLNRRAAMELLAKELVRNKRQGEGLAIGICDIDYFKKINDTWGHQTGDEVLRRLARILTADLREYDSVARIGGEEFLLIIPLKRERDAESIFERLRATIEQEKIITKDGEEIGITVSIGVSNATADSDMEKLLSEADVALYQAKGQGRNLVAYAGNT